MTFTTVSAPRGLANTSNRPRNGLSLKRTGAAASSLEANSNGALERRKGALPRENAKSSRVGAPALAVSRNLLAPEEGLPAGLVIIGGPAPLTDDCEESVRAFAGVTSNPASSNFVLRSSASSGVLTVIKTLNLPEPSLMDFGVLPIAVCTASMVRSASSRDSDC